MEYENFIKEIPSIIENKDINIELAPEFLNQNIRIVVRFMDVVIKSPDIYPHQAKNSDKDYSFSIYTNIKLLGIQEGEIKIQKMLFENILLCKIPLMVKSSLCNTNSLNLILRNKTLYEIREDPVELGGYFIINGISRMLVKMFIEKY